MLAGTSGKFYMPLDFWQRFQINLHQPLKQGSYHCPEPEVSALAMFYVQDWLIDRDLHQTQLKKVLHRAFQVNVMNSIGFQAAI